jgi:hypothetical protein
MVTVRDLPPERLAGIVGAYHGLHFIIAGQCEIHMNRERSCQLNHGE